MITAYLIRLHGQPMAYSTDHENAKEELVKIRDKYYKGNPDDLDFFEKRWHVKYEGNPPERFKVQVDSIVQQGPAENVMYVLEYKKEFDRSPVCEKLVDTIQACESILDEWRTDLELKYEHCRRDHYVVYSKGESGYPIKREVMKIHLFEEGSLTDEIKDVSLEEEQQQTERENPNAYLCAWAKLTCVPEI